MKNTIIIITLFFITPYYLKADGTKQLRKNASEKSSLVLYDRSDEVGPLRKFATYEADSSQHLCFTIVDYTKELVLMGFLMEQYKDTIYFRIKDESGQVVRAPQRVSNSGNGTIQSYTEAVKGPDYSPAISNPYGYKPLSFKPSHNGTYYIEFNVGHPDDLLPNDSLKRKQVFKYFDLSIVNEYTHKIIEGRVWSKAWDFTTQGVDNIFSASLYIYADDGVVTKVDFNGMKPFGFVVSSNQTGTSTLGTPYENRQSQYGNVTYPQYKIFLTYPDPQVFSPGKAGILLSVADITCKGSDGYCINFTTTTAGALEVLLEFNNTPGYQPESEDVLMSANVLAAGQTCVAWDGKTGTGKEVEYEKQFMAIAKFQRGLTHLPLYDVEGHPNGYIVEMIVPQKKLLRLYWDDTQIVNGTQQASGCMPDSSLHAGCHGWGMKVTDPVGALPPIGEQYLGNNRTINTWWYATLQTDTLYPTLPSPFTIKIFSDHQVSKDTALMCDKSSIQLKPFLSNDNKSLQYTWTKENGELISHDREPTVGGLHQDTYVNLQVYNPEDACASNASYLIKVRRLFVPNLITPNDDKANDHFEIENLFPGSELSIYNRWGDRVFKTSEYKNEWKAENLTDGVYYYRLVSGDYCGTFEGWIEVIR